MPDISQFVLYLTAALLLAATPGPGIFYVAARSLAGGRAEGVASSFGTALGGLAHVLAGARGVFGRFLGRAGRFSAVQAFWGGYFGLLGRAPTIVGVVRGGGCVLGGVFGGGLWVYTRREWQPHACVPAGGSRWGGRGRGEFEGGNCPAGGRDPRGVD